uniref:Smoothelin domain-containing protein n=1 Tax=Timema bartmani TaxID=61472 RepID=A0A7R9HZF8_9NEOP|nr:unnamed protein product [Timema bartmani]
MREFPPSSRDRRWPDTSGLSSAAEWQQTEDFGRKKEIRARMYKLREQRLKEFYTTGEVLHDVLSSTSSLDDSSAVRQVKSGGSNTRYHSSSDISSSQKKDQVVSKNSSYTTSSSIRHADSLSDDSFLTLKSKEIRDSESPTREFHKRQEKNVSDDDGYWRVVQESSSGAYEESGTIRDGVETTIHSKYKTEQSRTAGDSTDGLSTTTRAASSQEKSNIPSDGNSQNESSVSSCVVQKGGDIGGDLISSNSTSQFGKWSSTSSSSFVTQGQQQEQMSSSSSSSRAISSSIQNGQDISSHYILDSSNSAKDDSSLIKELSTSVSEIGQNIIDVSSKRVTQRSQTSDFIIDENLIISECDRVSTTGQNTNVSTSIDRSPLIDKNTIIDFNISINDTFTTGTSVSEEKSSKVVEQKIMSELHKLDSFLSTQNATDSTPVSPHDARDSASWTIVSSTSKHRNCQDVPDQGIIDEFVFRSGNADNIKDTTNLQSKEFIDQEKNSSLIVTNEKVLIDKETKIYVDGTPQKIVHNTGKSPTEELKGTSNRTSNQETTTAKPTEGQYITTYKQDYTNKRISVDVSPTHEAFARSLRASPEHGTPNSTRSSSKVSLDRSSPEKSPSKSPYRNRTSADNSLSSPNRSSPEKSTVRPSSARSSPEKINKTYPSRISPEKTGPTNISSQKTQSIFSPDKISSPRLSPDKFTASNSERTVPGRISPEKYINKVPATRVSPESTTTSARLSPDRKSPQKDTINKTDRSSPARRSPEKMMPDSEPNTQTGKLQRQPERRVSSADRPRESSAVYSPTRKLSDSTRITITNKDINVQTASVKERRKFSSGATRSSTKKRSSTPGVSPSLSPSREDDVNLRMPSQDVITTEKPHAIDKVLSPNKYPNTTPEATVRSTQSSPERKIPARQNESPKSVLDKLTRDKSPEYSSEGSLIHEFSYKQNDEKSAFTQVKQKKDSHRESLDSSPERNNFTPIKVFKTTPETSSQENEPADETKTSPSTAKSPVQQSSVTFSSKKAEPLKTVCPIQKQGQDMPSDREPIKPDKPLSSRPEYFQEKDTSTQQYYKDTEQITTLENDESLSSCDYPKQNEKPSQLLQETSKPNIYNVVGEYPDNIEISPKGYVPAKYSREPEMQNTKNFIENEIQESQKVSGKHDKTINKSRRSTSSDTKSSSVSPCSSSPERPKISTSTSRVEITLRPTPKGHLSKNYLPSNERPGKEIPVTGCESPQKRFTTTKQVPSPIRNKPKRPAMDSDETPDSSPERTPRGKIITKTPSKIRLLKPDKNNDAASRLPSKPSVTSVKTNTSPRSEQNTSAPIKKDKPFERKLSEKSIPSLSRVSDRPQNQRTNKVITRIPSSTDSSLRHGRAPEKPSEVSRSKKDIQKTTKLQTNVQYSVDIIPHKNYSVRKPESSPEGRSPSLSPERVIPSSSSRYPSYKRSPITSPERQIIPKTIKTVDDNRANIPTKTSQFPSPDRHTRIPIQGKHTKSPTSPRYPADIIRKPSDHISQISGQNKPKDTMDRPSPRTSHKPDNSRAHYSSPSSSPDRTQQRITRFTATVKVNPVDKNVDTAKETKLHKTRKSPDDIDDRSTDRSSTISSPETVKTAEDIVEELYENISEKRKLTEIHLDNLPEKRDLSPSDQEKDVPTLFTNKNNDYFESSTVINNRAHTLRQDTYDVNQHNEYITDDYDVDDVQDETPPEEFIVDDDSPVHLAPKLSSIPMRKQNLKPNQPYIEKSPLTKQIKSKPTAEKNTTVPRTKIIITTKSIPIKDVRNLNSRPISTKPTKEVSTVLHPRSEPRVPLRRDQSTASQSPRNVSTKDIKISRVNSDNNVIKHHITSPSKIQPKKQPSKSDVTVPSERNKISSVTAHTSSTRHQQPTTKNVTSVRSFGIKNTKSTTTIQRPGQKPMVSKEEPNRRPMSIAVASTKRTTVTKEKTADKKHLKTKKIVPTKEHNTSPFFSEDEQEVPDIVDSEDRERFSEQEDDETDQEYIKELEDLRQTEEQLYASKVTHIKNREDRLLSTTYNGNKTSDSLTAIQIQLPKSSRESSPEYSRRPLLTTDDEDSTGPRYADKVSEPDDDDDDSPKKKPPAVFRKPILHPVPLNEEYTDEEEPDLRPTRKEHPVKLNKGEHYGEFPNSQTPIEKRHPDKIFDRPVQYVGTPKEDDKIFLQLEKVTDLDEESDTDEALKSVSVANRVSLFLEEAKKTTAPHKSPQLVEESKKPMDSPTSVRKAKLMFENIAHTQKSPVKSPQSPRKNIPDIVDRPSIFEARRGGKVTSPVKDEDFIHQEREFTEKQDESNYYDHSRRTSHYTNDEKHTGEDIPIKPLVTKHKTSPTAPSDDEDDFDDAESFTQDEIKQSRRPSSTQEHPSDIKSRKPQTTAKLSNRSISPALKNNEYQHFLKDAAPIARKPSGTTRRPSYTSPEVSNEQIKSRDDLPSTKISSDTYTRRKPSFPDRVVSPKPHDVAPDQNSSSDKHYNEKTLSSEHPVHRRPSTPSHKDYSHENKIPKETYSKHKPSSPERTTNFKPRAESPPRKISTDTIIRKISTPKEVPTEPFNKRQPTSSNKPREISPVNKISTATLTRRKPTSPDRSIEEPAKICTDTYSRGKPKYPEQTVDNSYGTYTKVRPSTKQESVGRFDTFTVKGKSIGKKVVLEDENKTISKDYISRKESSPVDVYSEPKKGYLQDTFSSRKHAHEDLSSDEDSSKRNNFILSKTVDNSFERIPDKFPEDSHFYADTDKEPTIGYLQDTFSSRKHARDDSQSDDDTTRGRDSLPRKIPDNICSAKIVDDFPEDRHFYPSKSRRDVSPADKDTSSIRRYSKEQPKDITTKQYSPTRKGASPTREISSKKEQSPARDYPRRDYSPSSKKSPSPSPTRKDLTHRASFSTNKDAITRRESAHRPENISSLRKDSLPKDKPKSLASKYLAKVEQKLPLKTVDVRPGGKFGVSLRQTNVTTSTLQRRQSGDVTKTKSCAPNGEEVIVEDIFDLELLEMMLERAVLYDERSAIRAQIRIVRRTMSESTTTTTTTTKTTKSTSSVEVTQRLSGREAPRSTGDRDSPRRRGSHERPDEAEPGRRPSSGYEPNTSDKTRAWRRSPERPGNAEPGRRPSSEYEPSISDKPQGRRVSHERPEDAVLGRRPSLGYEPNTSDKTRAWRRSPERPGDVEPGRRPSSGYEPNTSDKPRARKSSPITQRFFPEEGRRRPSQDEAVTLVKPSVEELKLAEGAQRNLRKVESLFLTCLWLWPSLRTRNLTRHIGSGSQYLGNKHLFGSSNPSWLCPPSVATHFTRAAGNLGTYGTVPTINPCRHRTTRKETLPWPASIGARIWLLLPRAAKAVFASEIFPQQKRSGARREDFAHKKDIPYKRRTQDRSQSRIARSDPRVERLQALNGRRHFNLEAVGLVYVCLWPEVEPWSLLHKKICV